MVTAAMPIFVALLVVFWIVYVGVFSVSTRSDFPWKQRPDRTSGRASPSPASQHPGGYCSSSSPRNWLGEQEAMVYVILLTFVACGSRLRLAPALFYQRERQSPGGGLDDPGPDPDPSPTPPTGPGGDIPLRSPTRALGLAGLIAPRLHPPIERKPRTSQTGRRRPQRSSSHANARSVLAVAWIGSGPPLRPKARAPVAGGHAAFFQRCRSAERLGGHGPSALCAEVHRHDHRPDGQHLCGHNRQAQGPQGVAGIGEVLAQGGKSKTVVLKLSKASKKLLAAKRSLTITLTSAGHRRTVLHRTTTLHRKG